MSNATIYVKLYKESKWQRFKRKVLRRKTLWSDKSENTYVNRDAVMWTAAGSQTITHISLWDSKEGGQFLGTFEVKP